MKINEKLSVQEQGGKSMIVCGCGHAFCPASENYKLHARTKSSPLSKAGPHVNPYKIGNGRFTLREFACPRCLVLLDVEVVFKNEPPRWDAQLALADSRGAVPGGA